MLKEHDSEWTVDGLVEALGRSKIRAELRVSNSTLSTWKRQKKIAADRYDAICAMCRERELPDPPRTLFTFKPRLPAVATEHANG